MLIKYNEKEYEIIYDKSNSCYKTPFHNDLFMMKIMLNCLEKAEYFIETGLFLGYTSYFVAKNFTNINCYSCEINPDFFKLAFCLLFSVSIVFIYLKLNFMQSWNKHTMFQVLCGKSLS
jgi:hypothetical protein